MFPTNHLHISGGSDPIRAESLGTATDTSIVTTDINGVFHKRGISTLQSGIANSCTTVSNVPRINATNGNLGCGQITDNLIKVGINMPSPVAKFHVRTSDPFNDGIMVENNGSAGLSAELDLKSYTASGQQVWGIRGSGSANSRPRSFSIFDYSASNYRFLIDSLGNVGIGTNTSIPGNKLELNSGINGQSGLRLTHLTNASNQSSNPNNVVLSVSSSGDVILVPCCGAGGTSQWTKTGNKLYPTTLTDSVGIGTANPIGKLHVNGQTYIGSGTWALTTSLANCGVNTRTPSNANLFVEGGILTEGLKVALTGTCAWKWPDYVFANNYKLKPLDEVEDFVKENNHLPGIPSSSEIEKEGMDLPKIQAKQMEKIEELTLYIIQMQKQIDELKNEKANSNTSTNKN